MKLETDDGLGMLRIYLYLFIFALRCCRVHDVLFSLQVMWVCNQCRKQQEILTNSGEWFTDQGPKPKAATLGPAVSEPAMCGDSGSRSQIPTGSSAPTAQNNQQHSNSSKRPAAGPADQPSSRSRSEPPQDRCVTGYLGVTLQAMICTVSISI